MRRLPFKQRKFVANYILQGGNGTKAVFAAGYVQGYNSARVTACRLLAKANVMSEIESHVQKSRLNADQVIEELSGIAQVKTEIDGNQRLKALELLGKFHKLFVDKVESTDTSERDGIAMSLTLVKLIQDAALADGISEVTTAIQLYPALSRIPAYADITAWPEQFQSAIRDSLTHPEAAPIDGGTV
jgi:hypothetical protein